MIKQTFHYSATIWYHMESESGRVYTPSCGDIIKLLSDSEYKHSITTVYFQLEEGKGGLQHWQMHFVLEQPVTGPLKTWLRSILDIDNDKPKQCVWMKKAMYPMASINYAQKVKTRIDGPYKYIRGQRGRMFLNEQGLTIGALLNATPNMKII